MRTSGLMYRLQSRSERQTRLCMPSSRASVRGAPVDIEGHEAAGGYQLSSPTACT